MRYEEKDNDEEEVDHVLVKEQPAKKEKNISKNNSKREQQLKRLRKYKDVINLEEESYNKLYEIEYYDKNYRAIENIAKGNSKNVLVQTAEKATIQTQTEPM